MAQLRDDMTLDNLNFIINHVFLPPKLPQTADDLIGEKNSSLLNLLHLTALRYKRQLSQTTVKASPWPNAVKMLRYFEKFENTNSFSAEEFATAVRIMLDGDAIGVHVAAQNAGLVLTRTADSALFTSFEASPTSDAVNGTIGKLLISYPGPAIAVPWSTVTESTFLTHLGGLLEKLKREVLPGAAPRATKAGEALPEERDSADPRFVTELLTGILRGVGQEVRVERFMKRVGDEVLWDNAKIPWRRSPLWLVVRVALRMVLGPVVYKWFMIFFMAQVLQVATTRMEEEEEDRLFVMNAKLARRVYKLRDVMPGFVLDEALTAGNRAHARIEEGWLKAQGRKRRYWGSVKDMVYVRDATLTMTKSRSYIMGLKDVEYAKPAREGFIPNEVQRIDATGEGMPDLSKLKKAGTRTDIMLADFETWVMNNLDTWQLTPRSTACHHLGERMEDYMAAAKPAYEGNPLKNSILILTTMELWVALDKLAVNHCRRLLSKFSPEFNPSFLSALLLPQAQQRARLTRVENYIKERRSSADSRNDSVFSENITGQTFSVCYFRSSKALQLLEAKILKEAEAAVLAKTTEFEQKQQEYENLQVRIQSSSCDIFTHWSEGWRKHHHDCRKCALILQATEMRIEVHECPLPEETLARAAVMFELRCPVPFAIWRRTTFRILTSLCTAVKITPNDRVAYEGPATYSGLKQYFDAGGLTRPSTLTYSSLTKSFLATHYHLARFPTTIEDICVKNALNFGLYDTSTGIWTANRPPAIDIHHLCTFYVPPGPYKSLQYAIKGTSHTANQVLARQYECSQKLQLHEYIAFGLLRSGCRLQWLNILRELRSRTLTFGAEAVKMLVLQAAWQVGLPGTNGERECHVEPVDSQFGAEMMRELNLMLTGIEANWQEVVAVQTMVVLAGQIIAGTNDGRVRVEAVNFLRKVRSVSLTWTREISRKLLECDPGEVREFQVRVVQMAATCRMTFDVERCYFTEVLASEEDVTVLVECATIIHDNVPAVVPQGLKELLERDRRMAYALEQHLRELVTGSTHGINLEPIWSDYKQCKRWTAGDGKNNRWVYTYTKTSDGSERQKVHYNLISGELLVGALALGKLPVAYSCHTTFQELFAEKVLLVFQSNAPGMTFQTTNSIDGYKIAFALHDNELIIRTKREEDGMIHQLIPRSKLDGDFPENIIKDHVFWLQLPSAAQQASSCENRPGRIDLRNRDTPWTVKDDWYIAHSYDASKTYLKLGRGHLLLDIRSATATMITNVLAPLEFKEFIEVQYESETNAVVAHLPRLKLDFRIDKNYRLVYKQFPGMTIDDEQRFGTFVGLQNVLVVRQDQTRSVIVPYGTVLFQRQDSHMKVEIKTKKLERVKYHIYTINTILGTLVGNGSLTSHLYKIYLHAVTSHCHPDPLTCRTGTEEALAGLRAAATRSFQSVKAGGVDVDLFKLIAALTLKRMYYPIHLKRMQQVSWRSGLSSVAQHDEFYRGVMEVVDYAGQLNIFEDVEESIVVRTVGDQGLAKRAAMRNAIFRTEQFGGSIEDRSADRVYKARHDISGSVDEARVSYVVRLVASGQQRLNVHPGLAGVLSQFGDLLGPLPVMALEQPELRYDSQWLDPDLAKVWVPLYDAMRCRSQYTEKYDWIFLLGTLAYSGAIDLRLLETLLAFATDEAFSEIDPPDHPSFNLSHGYAPDPVILANIISDFATDFGDSDESKLDSRPLETELETRSRCLRIFMLHKVQQAEKMVKRLVFNWPCTEPDIDNEEYYTLYNIPEVLEALKPQFASWTRNSEFRAYISAVQKILDRINTDQRPVFQVYKFKTCKYTPLKVGSTICFSDLLMRSPPCLPIVPRSLQGNPLLEADSAPPEPKYDSLRSLVQDFRGRQPIELFQKRYIAGLEGSILAFQEQIAPSYIVQAVSLVDRLRTLEAECKKYMEAIFRAISSQLEPLHLKGSFMAFKAGLWPRISPLLLLQQLATNGAVRLAPGWKATLVTYGTAITMVQRLTRLLCLAPNSVNGSSIDFLNELENTGHLNWKPLGQPDWLLIEIENNFLIRPVQADMAVTMITPPGNHNSIVQLCMGEGKTSVIVPIVAASLADGTKLVRVVVLKPLAGQMFQTLVQKLGGLVNRRIFCMPFSRGIEMGMKEIADVKSLYEDCMKSGGILLVQPEHIMSFKLLGLEWLYNSKNNQQQMVNGVMSNCKSDGEVAKSLIGTQRWLDMNSRDILDESDEILNVRHELIYTIGNPVPIENNPDRWIIIQEILDLIQQYFKTAKDGVEDFELARHKQVTRFGSIRILNLKAGRKLIRSIAFKIVEDQLLTVSFRLFPADKRRLAVQFITEPEMTLEQAKPLLGYFDANNLSSGMLYLLRGLIAHNILLFSLHEKRWKVDYGLDLKRSPLAVPYRAKDSPAGRAEFSHPDVAITLTCLSYYYGGLDDRQLDTCFRNLLKSDNPALQYERWIKGVTLPKPYLNRLTGINLDDKKQWKEIVYPTFNYNKAVIDTYLSGVVFPAEAKEFPHKLSTSGWDVAAKKIHPTTGFSGTNDNRYLLPKSMKQLDTKAQLNTNARVLSYLLQPENSYMCITGPNNERLDVEALLKILAHKPGDREIKVLLDVGAQVLELSNQEVAERWLDEVEGNTAVAAVYFSESDELTVLTRDGNIEALMVSAFADRLDDCLVYLDEAHTRGTDLKLPVESRAAVTLGPNLTKDRLVQACMRMRKLGNGHSVLFCGPPEIDRKIMTIARKNQREIIEVRDVLVWSMNETCSNARKLLPIWAKQGISYQNHLKAWDGIGNGRYFPKVLLEKEAQTLQEHYGFEKSKDNTIEFYRRAETTDDDLGKILATCKEFGVKSFGGARMLEQQERELAHEVECERVNQRPPRAQPANPNLSKEVSKFIATGTIPPTYRKPTHITPAFSLLATTSAKKHDQYMAFSQELLSTSDFCKVVVGRASLKNGMTGDFLRPVNWIVSSTLNRDILVIMSSFEVNELLPEIRQSPHATLHMYSPQVTQSTPSYELLTYCPIPKLPVPWQADVFLVDQLNIFAGQLYFPNHEAYQRVCGFLGLHLEDTSSEKRVVVRSDGYVDALDRHILGMRYASPFTNSPVTLLKTLLGLRHKGQSYISTHMGHVLNGRSLTVADIEQPESWKKPAAITVIE